MFLIDDIPRSSILTEDFKVEFRIYGNQSYKGLFVSSGSKLLMKLDMSWNDPVINQDDTDWEYLWFNVKILG